MAKKSPNLISVRLPSVLDVNFLAQVAREQACRAHENIGISDLVRGAITDKIGELKKEWPDITKEIYGEDSSNSSTEE